MQESLYYVFGKVYILRAHGEVFIHRNEISHPTHKNGGTNKFYFRRISSKCMKTKITINKVYICVNIYIFCMYRKRDAQFFNYISTNLQLTLQTLSQTKIMCYLLINFEICYVLLKMCKARIKTIFIKLHSLTCVYCA